MPVTLSAQGSVDLHLSGATAPSSATLGDYIPVSWTVDNLGAGTALAGWTDAVYASPTSNFNVATALLIQSFSHSDPLSSHSSYTQTQSIRLPASALGDSFLLFVTNAGNTQAETDTTNDIQAFHFTDALSAPSLAVSAVVGPAGGSADLGDTIPVSWTVTNTSASVATAAGWSDAVYLSDSPTFDNTATFVGSFKATIAGPLAPGASYTQTQNVTLPYTTLGSRYLLVVADQDSGQPVSGSTPIVGSTAIDLRASDLAISATAPASTVLLGSPFIVSWTVTNQGSVAANAGWEDAVFVSSSSNFDPVTATLLTTMAAPSSLAAGASYTQNTTIKLPSMPAGQQYLFFVADRNNDQGETNESNNVASKSITVFRP